ncbi:MAG: hypothetical protein KDK69_04330 [Chlamydiia bacterium]|nr:hypothetical protein [Chlamydiia bacterium]
MELSGPQAFYNQPQYEQITRKELQDHFPHEKPAIVFEKGARWVRLTTEVIFNGSSLALIYCVTSYCLEKISSRLSLPKLPKGVIWITIPIGVYNHLYIGVGWLVHWGSQPWLSYDHERCSNKRGELFEKAEVVKRLNIQANGCFIDTIIMGKKENFDKGRWLIVSLGSGERYEELYDSYLMLAEKLNANLLLYNYPSYGASGGYLPNKAAILAAHQAMHFFAREMLKAREIVDIGNSIGGGVQGESLKDLVLAEQVKYVFLKHMTFARLSGVADNLVINHAGLLISFLNF